MSVSGWSAPLEATEVAGLGRATARSTRAIPTYRAVAVALGAADAVALAVAIAVASPAAPRGSLPVLLMMPPLWLAILAAAGLYRITRLSAPEEFGQLFKAMGAGLATMLVALVLAGSPPAAPWLLTVAATVAGLELAIRRGIRWWIRRAKATGDLALRTLIVGANQEASSLGETLAPPARGYAPVGCVAPDGHARASRLGLPVVSTLDELERAIDSLQIDCVFIASSAVTPEQMLAVTRAARRRGAEVRVSATLPQLLSSRLTLHQIGQDFALALRPARIGAVEAGIKRGTDILLAAAGLIVSLPILVLAALAIRATSEGPALFRQQRVTSGGRSFTMLKLRTMVHAPSSAPAEAHRLFFKLEDDPRLTPIGRLLRALSIDELPQLWNVIRGDMSLVGPRPLPVEQVSANEDLLQPRHEVRAGLTGWWQINGRSDVDPETAVRMDLFYIENRSLMLDLYILLKTLGVVIAGRGAR